MKKTIFCVLVMFLTGGFAARAQTLSTEKTNSSGGSFKYPPKAVLYRFEVNPGKEAKFAEWMKFLADNHPAVIETLDREKTYFESVFTEIVAGKTFVYWIIFKGMGGKPVESSPLEVDKKHLEYWNECIKKGSRTTFETQYYLTPKFLDEALKNHQTHESD